MEKRTISVIIPLYNEEDNVKPLFLEIKEVMAQLAKDKKIKGFEVIFVNDGSTDNTQKNLEELKKLGDIRIIELRKNFGQTPGLKAGFDHAKGDLIVTMDGDLQNDPKDIPKLIEKLDEGYDVVSGWRHNRKDILAKKVASKLMNKTRRKVIGDNLHDYGCSLKIYKKECLKDLELFGELHRYITAYLYIKGYKIGEIKVSHRPRKSGKTKYTQIGRGINGLFDLFYLKFWSGYASKPLHFFGRLGLYQWILAIIILIEQIIKAIIIRQLTLGPLLVLAAIFGVTGLLFIIFGFLSEIMIRTYFSGEKRIYNIKKTL